MGNLIRRNKTIPVQAQRVEDPPQQQPQVIIPANIQIPPSQSPTQHHTHVTNNFYITNPAPAAPTLPPAPSQPQKTEVHYHTTIQEAPRKTSSRYRRKATSYFGMLSITAGMLSIAGQYVSLLAPYSIRAAEVGLIAGGAGLLGAMLIGYTGKIVPIMGLIISAAGFLFSVRYISPPDIDMADASTHTVKTIRPLPESAVTNSPAAISKPAVTPAPTAAPAVPKPTPDSARASLESARIAAAVKLKLDYPTAKANAERSIADLEEARKKFAPGSPEIVAAVQKRIDAEAAFRDMQQQLHEDPAVASAEQLVKSLSSRQSK